MAGAAGWGPNYVGATGWLGICGSVRIVGNEYAGGAAHAPQVGSQSVGRESNEQNYKGH